MLSDDRLFPADPTTREIARQLFASIRSLPLISPHGHTEPRWYAENKAFPDPAQLLVVPDHYVTRMLVSQGVTLESLGVPRRDGGPEEGVDGSGGTRPARAAEGPPFRSGARRSVPYADAGDPRDPRALGLA